MFSADTHQSGTPERADVVVVGARIAGASLAAQLAGAGHSVVVVDRARFPSDTLSTHLIQVSGVRLMQLLGVLDRLAQTGAPFLTGASVCYDGIDLSTPVRSETDWPPGGISVSRNELDLILVDAATAAGARMLTGTSLTGLCRDRANRASGVRVRSGSVVTTIAADLVIGADGRNSRLGELVGARTYNTTENQRFVYWADFEGAVETGRPSVHHYRDGAELTIGFSSDNGHFTVMVCPGLADFGWFKRSLPDSYDKAVARCAPLRPILAGARRVSRPIGTAYAPGYFRESAGPGWGLIGDAGHFKDPTLGQGISDALRQSQRLAGFLDGVRFSDHASVDRAMKRWYRWRDRDAAPMYWLAWDFARAGELSPLERGLMRCIAADDTVRQQFVDGVLSHRVTPYEVLRPRLLMRAARDMNRHGLGWSAVARELGARMATEVARQWRIRRPCYGPLPRPSQSASSVVTGSGNPWAGDVVEDRDPAGARHRT